MAKKVQVAKFNPALQQEIADRMRAARADLEGRAESAGQSADAASADSAQAQESAALAQREAQNAGYPSNAAAYADEADFLSRSSAGEFGIYAGAVWQNDAGSAVAVSSALWRPSSIGELRQQAGSPGARAYVDSDRGGLFSWRSQDPRGGGDDGGLVYSASGGGWWVRDWDQSHAYARWWGLAPGDSSTDAGAVLTDILSADYYLHLQAGTYYIRSSVQLASGYALVGSPDVRDTELLVEAQVPVFSGPEVKNVTLRSITVEGQDRATAGLDVGQFQYGTLEKFRVYDVQGDGINLTPTDGGFTGYSRLESVYMTNCDRGFVIDGTIGGAVVVNSFHNCTARECRIGFDLAGSNLTMTRAVSEDHDSIGFRLRCARTTIVDPYTEGCDVDFYFREGCEQLRVMGVREYRGSPVQVVDETNDGVYLDYGGSMHSSTGRSHLNVIPNGGLSAWNDPVGASGVVPPHVPFRGMEYNLGTLESYSRTREGWRLVSPADQGTRIHLDLTPYLDLIEGKTYTVGAYFLGDPGNTQSVKELRVRGLPTDGGNYNFTTAPSYIELSGRAYGRSTAQTPQMAFVRDTFEENPADYSEVFAEFHISNGEGASGDTEAMTFAGFFLCLGHGVPNTFPQALTAYGDQAISGQVIAEGYSVGARQVVGTQQGPISDDSSDAANATTVNQILAAMRAHGLISS